jgi:sugar phosphate isomerase/epimerase
VSELAALCGALGGRTLEIGIQSGRPASWSDFVTSLEMALTIAAEFNLELAITPDISSVVDSAHTARRLLHEVRSPRLKMALDPSRMVGADDAARGRWVLDEAVDMLGEHVVLAHARASTLDARHWLRLMERVRAPLIVHAATDSELRSALGVLRAAAPAVATTR